MKKTILSVLIIVLILTMVSCSNDKEINSITDFTQYATLTEDVDKIEVSFDNHSGAPFCFTIDEQEDIVEIMSIIFSATFENMGKDEMNDGTHTSIHIFQGDKEYSMHVHRNREGKNYYSFSNTELNDKITELAREAGAFEDTE